MKLAKPLRWGMYVVAALAVLAVGVIVLLHTPPAKRYVLGKVSQLLRSQNVEFSAADLSYNLLELNVSLRNATVRSSATPDLPPLARIGSLELDLGLRQLLQGSYHVEDALLQQVDIHVVVDETGRDNIPKPPSKEDEGGEIRYLIDQARANGGSIVYEDRRQKIVVRLPDWRLDIDGNPATGNHEVTFAIGRPGSLAFAERSAPLRELRLNALLEESAVDVKELRLTSGESQISVSGRLNDFSDPRFDTRVNATFDLESIAGLAGLQEKVSGTLHAQIGAKGPLGSLIVQAHLEGDALQVRRFDRIALSADASFDAARQRVELSALRVDSPSGNIRGEGQLALTPQAGQSSATLQLRGINLENVSRSLDLPIRLASRATGRIEGSWPGAEFDQAVARANLNLSQTRQQPAPDVLPVAGSLVANIRGRSISVQIPRIQALAAEAKGAIQVDARERLAGELTADVGSLGQLVQQLNLFLGKGPGESALPTTLEGPATLTAQLGGTVDNPQVATSISSGGLQVGTLRDVNVDVDVDYGADQVTLQNAAVNWRGQSVTASGTVGLKGRSPALNLRAQIDRISVADVLAGLEKDIPAEGTITAQADITGTADQPRANVSLAATGLMLYAEAFGDLTAQALLENQLLRISSLRLDKPDSGSLIASGTYNLETKAYSLDASAEDLAIRQMMLPGGVPVRGVLDLRAQGSGTASDPNLDLTLAADDLQVRDQELGSLNLTAHAAHQQADIKLQAPKYKMAADARIGIQEPYPARFALRLDGTDLASLPIPQEQKITGSVTAAIEGTAPLSNWKEGQVQARVADLDVTLNGKAIRTEGPLIAQYRDGRLAVEQATITAAGSRLSVEGDLPLEAPAAPGSVKIRGTFDLAALSEYLPQQNVTAGGQVTLDGEIRGTLKQIDPNLTLALSEGSFSSEQFGPPLRDATLRVDLRDGSARIETLSANWASAKIRGGGEVPLGLIPGDLPVEFPKKGGPANFTLDVENLELASIPQTPEKISGTVSLRLEAQAQKPSLDALRARLTFPQLKVNLGGLEVAQDGEATVLVENSAVRVERFRLTGPETEIALSGTAGLEGKRLLDLQANGRLDAAVLSLFADNLRTRGETTFKVAVGGTVSEPSLNGSLAMTKGMLGLDEPRILADNVDLRVEMAGDRVTIAKLTADLNGGDLVGGGGLRLKGSEVADLNVSLQTKDVYLDYPENLRTLSSADVKIGSQANGDILVTGQVRLLEGSFTEDVNLDRGLMSILSSQPELELTEERSPLLSRVRFRLDVDTESPLVVDNNLAKAAITLDVRLLGSYYRPGMSGRLIIEEGGELYLNERTYLVDRGIVTFTGEQRIEPSLDIVARTEAAGYDITLQVQGDPGDIESTLTSDPALPEPDIVAILLTGRTLEEIRGAEVDVAKEQLLSYLTGRLTGKLSSQLEQALGLTQVRIEPGLIAAEENPTARLTVGQDITRRLGLIYSMDLTNSSDQIWIADYDLTRRFNTSAVRQGDASYRLEFRHVLELGGVQGDASRIGTKREERKVGQVEFEGNTVLTENQLADRLDVKTGKDYDFFKVRRGLERINEAYAKRDLLEADVRLDRQVRDSTVDLTVRVNPGDKIQFVYEGWSVPGGVQEEVRRIWRDGVFDVARAEDALDAIRAALVKERYLRPEISYRITQPASGLKRVLFDIQPGVRYANVELVFEGAAGIEPDRLKEIIDKQDLEDAVYTDPDKVTELLGSYYREQGYLDARVTAPRYELNADTRTGRVVIPVEEGPLYRVGSLTFSGNHAFSDEQLAAELPLKRGEPYLPELREQSIVKLEELYQSLAFNEGEFAYSLSKNSGASTVDVSFQVTENRQSVLQEVIVSGNDRTSENMIRTQLAAKPGEILTLSALSQSRRNLYTTGAYSLVYLEREEIEGMAMPPDQRPMRLVVRVNEIQPFRFQYGGLYDTERGPGGIVDFSNRNSLGSARVLGFRVRYDGRLREARTYFSQPLLRRFPVKTLGSAYRTRESFGDLDTGHITNRIGFTIQQESRLWDRYVVNYGYRLERTHTVERTPDPILPLDEVLRIAPLTLALTRETRDDILDATRGSFTSHSLEYAPKILGSGLRYVKYFGQYFRYVPLSEPAEIPWSNLRKTRLVYAGAVRFGAGTGLGGQDLVLSERFFAGGGTTIRGFQQDFAGPLDALGDPRGGDAILVVNNELRFPLFHIVDGAGFLDLGNAFRSLSDISFSEIRRTAGVGLRLRTPYFLLRLDYGVKLDRRPGEPASRVFFSIGQAF